jgi:D-alanine--poly(phosphoribitol) ligase subunit 2
MTVQPCPDDVNAEPSPTPSDPVPAHLVVALIRRVVGIDVVDPTMNLLATGIIDSLAFVSLLLAIENEFAVSIDVNSLDVEDFQSVERITRFIRVQLSEPIPSVAAELPDEDGT